VKTEKVKQRKGETVNLVGFGRFEICQRNVRRGRNLQTGESLNIAATRGGGSRRSRGSASLFVAAAAKFLHRSASASLAPSATKAPAKVRPIQVKTRGREMTWFRIEAANNPYPTKTANVSSMKTALNSSIRERG
jgi:Bacterial DNA-binding protein